MIFRIKHDTAFTTLANAMLEDKRLSFKARGLLAFMLSKSDGWKFYRSEMESHSECDGRSSINSAIGELMKYGYMVFDQKKGDDGKWKEAEWVVNESPHVDFPSAVFPLAENRQLPNTNKPNTNIKRTIIRSTTEEAFDPYDLPSHLAKHPTIVKSWEAFVDYRHKVKHRSLSKEACIRLFKKMVKFPPEAIVEAIDTSIESGWSGIFPRQPKYRTLQGDLFPLKLTDDAKQLLEFVVSVLGNDIIRPRDIQENVDRLSSFYNRLSSVTSPHNQRQGPTEHLPWAKFFNNWLDFLREKQEAGFVLRSIKDLEMSNCRWQEFIKRCERFTGYNFTTGKRIE